MAFINSYDPNKIEIQYINLLVIITVIHLFLSLKGYGNIFYYYFILKNF
jgi:hypothetical protein